MNPKNGFKYRKTGGGEVDHLDIPKIYFHIYVKETNNLFVTMTRLVKSL